MTRASDLARLLGAGATINDGTTITTADNTSQLILQSTDADANAGPLLDMKRDSSSPADGDFLGQFNFLGENDASEEITYAQITGRTVDVSDGTEDGRIAIKTMRAGSSRSALDFSSGETVFNDDGDDVDFRVESDTNANMLFVDGGNNMVGIGTNSPVDLFSVKGASGASTDINFSGGDDTNDIRLFFGGDSSPFNGAIVYEPDTNNMHFKTSGTEKMRIDTSGNVMIGETTTVNSGFLNLATSANPNPLSMLCRSTTDSHECGIIMQKSSTDSGNFAQTADNEALGSIKFKGVDTSGVSRDGASIACVQNGTSGSSVPSELIFQTSGTEAMRIESDGQLSVGGTGGGTATIYVLSSDADSVSFFQSSSNATSGIRALQTSINQNAGNTNCQHLRATTQNVGTFRLDGNGASTFTSDERLKKNIETTRDGYLEDLAKLRVVKYNWHCHDEEDKKELGLIAQEVQKVFPKLVVEDEQELNGIKKPLAVKLSVLPMMLLKALQEANTKIIALESRITELEGS